MIAMTVKIYGIKNCDTMKKAFRWLDENGIAYEFHDFKKQGVSTALLNAWMETADWQKLLNKAGMTFRKLPDEDKQEIDQEKSIELMTANPSMIKRPVLDVDGVVHIGFKPEVYEGLFG